MISDYPSNVIPESGVTIIGIDVAEDGTECTVKGFYDTETKQYHIQEIIYEKKEMCNLPD